MSHDDTTATRTRWARLRFSIIGPLLASPPGAGELADRLRELAQRTYLHPTTRLTIRFGASTIERWWYDAKDEPDPVHALERKVPAHAGTHPAVSSAQALAIHGDDAWLRDGAPLHEGPGPAASAKAPPTLRRQDRP